MTEHFKVCDYVFISNYTRGWGMVRCRVMEEGYKVVPKHRVKNRIDNVKTTCVTRQYCGTVSPYIPVVRVV